MKLLICDDKNITYNSLPENIQGFHVVEYTASNSNTTEIITLEEVNGVWNIAGNKNIQISLNDKILAQAPLVPYTVYTIYFYIINKVVRVLSVPNNENYKFVNWTVFEKLLIGQSESNNIRASISTLKQNHAIISCVNEKYVISQVDSSCDIYVNGRKTSQQELRYGDIIFIEGIKIIWMRTYLAINNPNNSVTFSMLNYANINVQDVESYTQLTESERNIKIYTENDVFYHTPKIKSYINEEEISIDAPPEQDRNEKMPLILSIGSSAVIGITSSFTGISAYNGLKNGTMNKSDAYMQIAMCILLIISSVAIPFVTELWQKNQIKKREKLRKKKYGEYLEKNRQAINEIIKKQENILREKHLTLDEIANETMSMGYNLWGREIIDKDFLSVRLGIGSMPAYLKIDSSEEGFSLYDDELKDKAFQLVKEEHLLKDVPITISMIDNRITPIVVQSGNYKQYIDGIMLQIMFYYSSIDLKIVVLTTNQNGNNFDYVKYGNHCWSDNREIRYFATNEMEANQLSMHLEQIYSSRLPSNNGNSEDITAAQKNETYKEFKDYYLIVTDDFKSFKDLSIINRVINSNINVGFSLLVFSDSLKNLPSRLEKFIVIESGQSGVYSKTFDNTNLGKFNAEYLSNYDINQLAFKFSNIPLPASESDAVIPKSLNFLELYNVGKVEHLNVMSRWKTNTPMTSLNAPIGFQANNKQIGLDLHEKAHGPHGLIAGSTGSGKSEFIITYILSMAINYHPYEVQFVLIDYKGGGLAGAFENREKGIKIPHLIGTITNLDKSEMNRTLVSVKSELERRQRKFNEARDALGEGTIDIYKYQRLYREGKVKEPISHLFIVSDEFAELKQQQPDFMDELVSTARIGRSLGVHLILATQKPAGIVDDQIWSNSRFKVCLKVQTPEDSNEVLKKDDASKIRETGRFYLQVGNDELFELGQSAWAGDKYYPTDHPVAKIDDSIDMISNDGTIIKTINDDVKQNGENHGEQLSNIVKYLYDIAVSENIKFNSLWLPNIPLDIYLGNIIKKYEFKPTPFKIEAVLGEYDKPAKQEQGLYTLPLTGNTILFGGQGSGKENFITTAMYSTCVYHSPSEINYYIMDFGSETLSIFNKMPHVGSFITSDQRDIVMSLFSFLEKQLQKRKNLFAEYQGNYYTYCEKSGNTLPLISVILNSYEGFRENFDEMDDTLTHFLREGTKYGIIFTVSATSTSSLRSTALELYTNKVILQAQDPFDYHYILGAPNEMIPKTGFGRGMTIIDEEPCEFQTAYINNKDNITDTVKSTSKQLLDHYKFKVPEIKIMPKSATFDDITSKVKVINDIIVGYNAETADVIKCDFTQNKITTFIGTNTTEDNSFMCTIIDLVDSIKNVKLNIFDISSSISTDGEASYYNVDFLEPLQALLTQPSDVIQINIIIGIGFAKELLSEEEFNTLYNVLYNADKLDNKYFVIFDNYDRITNLNDTNFNSVFNHNKGFWFGNKIEEQEFYVINDILDQDIESKIYNKLYYIEDGKYTLIKGVGYIGDDFND